jgi:hypothetical protein
VPVRIGLNANELRQNPLRVGLSATVTPRPPVRGPRPSAVRRDDLRDPGFDRRIVTVGRDRGEPLMAGAPAQAGAGDGPAPLKGAPLALIAFALALGTFMPIRGPFWSAVSTVTVADRPTRSGFWRSSLALSPIS